MDIDQESKGIDRTPVLNGAPSYTHTDVMLNRISSFVEGLAVNMEKSYSLIQCQHFWQPKGKVDKATQEFYRQLKIPLLNGKPSLLLHGLGNSDMPSSTTLFQGSQFQILCNVSGSGKTRLLFEGLCRHWGFYLVAKQDGDGIGALDLASAISNMKHADGWNDHVFETGTQKVIQSADTRNVEIANRAFEKLFLARWIILYAFLLAAMKLNNGKLPKNIQRDWLRFQISPAHIDTSPSRNSPWKIVDPFKAAMSKLMGADSDALSSLTQCYSNAVFTLIETTDIHYVIDEAQVVGETYMGGFAGCKHDERPVLRPLVRYLDEQLGEFSAIVSGTGFSLQLFENIVTSSVAKTNKQEWMLVHTTGDFFNEDVQLSYVRRYLPPTFLQSVSGLHLSTRIQRWLKGRHRFTARYLQETLMGSWTHNSPASPHKVLNAFVSKMADYTPRDGNGIILEQEKEHTLSNITGFDWTKLKNNPQLLGEVAKSIHSIITHREVRLMWNEHKSLVEYGIARFVNADRKIKIEEPLVLVAIVHFFETTPSTIPYSVKERLQYDHGLGFEGLLFFLITAMFEEPTSLSTVFNFHGPQPSWADSDAQIVTPIPSGGYSPFSIYRPYDPSSIVPCDGKDPEAVEQWMKSGVAGWCKPSTMMGPDLMARFQLKNGKIALAVFQGKCRKGKDGNKDGTLAADVATDAVRSVIPSNFFQPLVNCQKSAQQKVKVQERIDAMHATIGQVIGGPDYILRVVAAYPLAANFDSTSNHLAAILKKDTHPIATLSNTALLKVAEKYPDLIASMDALKQTIHVA